jgi:hypothetical protein
MNTRHACSSIIPLCSHIIKKFSILAKTVQNDFISIFACSQKNKKMSGSLLTSYMRTQDNMRAQGYDGRTSMSGIHRGVLVMIRERIPTAQCVHCKVHVLNYYKPYTHGDLFMCWYISSSPQIKAKYSEILHAHTIFWRTISPLISIIFFRISGDVYFIISSN